MRTNKNNQGHNPDSQALLRDPQGDPIEMVVALDAARQQVARTQDDLLRQYRVRHEVPHFWAFYVLFQEAKSFKADGQLDPFLWGWWTQRGYKDVLEAANFAMIEWAKMTNYYLEVWRVGDWHHERLKEMARHPSVRPEDLLAYDCLDGLMSWPWAKIDY